MSPAHPSERLTHNAFPRTCCVLGVGFPPSWRPFIFDSPVPFVISVLIAIFPLAACCDIAQPRIATVFRLGLRRLNEAYERVCSEHSNIHQRDRFHRLEDQ